MAALLVAVSLVACGPKPEETTTTTQTTTTTATETVAPATPAGTESPMAGETPAGTESPVAGETPAGTESPAAGGGTFETAAQGLPGFEEVQKMALDIPTSPEAVARGKEVFTGIGTCSSCHGDMGTGDGPAGAALEPKPRNMTDPAGYKWGADAKGVFRTAYYGGQTGSPMTPFGEKAGGALTEDQVKDVTAFVLSLQKK